MAKKQHILASLRKAEQNIFVPSGLARGFLKSFPSISDDLASDLLTVLEEREGTASVEIGSQLPFNEWHRYLGGNRNADALMDRLLNSSYQFELEGPSLRERSALD